MHRRRLALLAALGLAVAACASPEGAVRVDPQVAHRQLARSAITTGEPSWPTRNRLFERGLSEAFDARPEAALAELSFLHIGTRHWTKVQLTGPVRHERPLLMLPRREGAVLDPGSRCGARRAAREVDPLLPDLRYAGACMTRLGDLARDLVARSESLDGLLRHLLGKRPRVTRAHVVWAYRLLLDREPETEAAIRQKLGIWATTRDLRAAFMSSPEFQNLNPGLGLSMEPTVVIKELEPGLRLFVDLSDVFIGHGILRGEYERAEAALVARTARSGMTVLDVGAHIGYFTVLMARLVGATGRVHAFEPLDSVATLLERSIRENRFEDRVCLARVAVGDGSGTRQLVFASRTLNSGGAYLAGPDGSVPAGHEERDVPVVALDDYPLRRPVAFIKVDVEGAEPLVFRGAERLLREDRPVVLAEVHPGQLERVCGLTPADVVAEMEGRGYECRDLDGGRVVRRVDRVRSVVFAPRERDSQA